MGVVKKIVTNEANRSAKFATQAKKDRRPDIAAQHTAYSKALKAVAKRLP